MDGVASVFLIFNSITTNSSQKSLHLSNFSTLNNKNKKKNYILEVIVLQLDSTTL